MIGRENSDYLENEESFTEEKALEMGVKNVFGSSRYSGGEGACVFGENRVSDWDPWKSDGWDKERAVSLWNICARIGRQWFLSMNVDGFGADGFRVWKGKTGREVKLATRRIL